MNDEHFQTLLARVLDDELTPTESDELIEWLRQNPASSSEVRKHLQLWELYSQQVRAERSSGAFAEACRTRLLAETDERKFVRETEQKLRRSVEPGGISLADRLLLLRQWIMSKARQVGRATSCAPQPQIRLRNGAHGVTRPTNPVAEFFGHRTCWALAAAAVILCVFVVPGFLRTQGVPELASGTEAQIQIVRGGQLIAAKIGLRLQPNDVIRTTGEGKAVISYGREATRIELKPNTELKFLTWKSGKRFDLCVGKLEATVARQRLLRPMILVTAQAEAQVLGTEFSLATTTNKTTLEVTEGKVKLTRKSDDTAVKVGAGQSAVAANGVELAALPRTGQILREIWTNTPGNHWTYLMTHTNYPDRPDVRGYLTNLVSFEMPSNWADNYGVRLRGFIHPPKTGDYTFWLAAKDDASLWLSPNGDPANKIQMAYSYGAASRDWQGSAAQRSATLPLTAGRGYYFEVLYKAGVGDDHLAVAWQGPGREREVIPGEFISPFKTAAKEKKR